MKRVLTFTLAFFACAPPFAWGEKGHYIVNEAATMSLPTDMPQFFYKAFPQLVWSAYDPDRWRGAGRRSTRRTGPITFSTTNTSLG